MRAIAKKGYKLVAAYEGVREIVPHIVVGTVVSGRISRVLTVDGTMYRLKPHRRATKDGYITDYEVVNMVTGKIRLNNIKKYKYLQVVDKEGMVVFETNRASADLLYRLEYVLSYPKLAGTDVKDF